MRKIGIIGYGAIGQKRESAIKNIGKLVAISDINENVKNYCFNSKITFFKDYNELINQKSIDIIFVCTSHKYLGKIVLDCIKKNKHVLVEKPGAIKSKDLLEIIKILSNSKIKVRVGFNHRYHRAILKAKELVDSGKLGKLLYIRGRYGHGGRLGYEKEWRFDKSLSGGGELIDQGPHLIDLARWFFSNELFLIKGITKNYFWNINVDDNAFFMLETKKKQLSMFHVSCTEWKNIFSFEIYGNKGKIEIEGLGKSYGIEKTKFYKMSNKMGPPETFIWEYPMEDNSWETEIREFVKDIEENRKVSPSIEDAYNTLRIIEKIYKENE